MEMSQRRAVQIRAAVVTDVPLILQFIRGLAEYEKELARVTADEAIIRESLFGPSPRAKALIALSGEEPIGFAVYFFSFSTFSGKPNLYIEDIFVHLAHRGAGFGKKLMSSLARIAMENDCGRMEWSVLNWNEPAMNFYRSLGAEAVRDWTVFHLDQPHLEKLAQLDRV